MDTYLVYPVLISSFIGVSWYYGYFHAVKDWFVTKRNNIKLVMSLMDKITTDVSNKKSAAFNITDTSKSANIIYERMGQQYILFVPYNRRFVSQMNQFKVELLRENNNPVDITQQPGIPYLTSANSLGGTFIRITNEDSELTHEYGPDEIPYYGEEVMNI